MDSELKLMISKFPFISQSFLQHLVSRGYTSKESLLAIPTEQAALKDHFSDCKEFLSNVQLRRTFQSILFEVNPEAAANEYKSFRFIAKQPGGPMAAFHQIYASQGASSGDRSANNTPAATPVEERKSAPTVQPSAIINTQREMQPSHSQSGKIAETRNDERRSAISHQKYPNSSVLSQRLSIVEEEFAAATVAQKNNGGNVFQLSQPAAQYATPKVEKPKPASTQIVHHNSAELESSLSHERIAISGRQTVVGTEYDACRNIFFDSKDNLTFDIKKFADNNLPEISILSFPQSLSQRLDLIGLTWNQKADFLVGQLENKLAANLANEPTADNDEEKVIVHYRFKSHIASRNIAASNYQPQNNVATHIVVGVEYGTEVIFVLSEKTVAGQKPLVAFLTEVIERIKRMKAGGSMGMEGRFTRIRCQAFSNGDDYQVKTFYHAAMILHSLMTESAGQKHIPQTAIILPLRQEIASISRETFNEMEQFAETTMSTKRSLTQLVKIDPDLSKILGIENLRAALKNMYEQILTLLKQKLADIRDGFESEKSIVRFLRENHTHNNRQANMVRYATDTMNFVSKKILSPLRTLKISENGVEPKIVLEIGIGPSDQYLAMAYLSIGDEECLKNLFPCLKFLDRQQLDEVNKFMELFKANKGKEQHFCYRFKSNVHSSELFTCFLEAGRNAYIVPNISNDAFIDVRPQKITTTSITLRVEMCRPWKQTDRSAAVTPVVPYKAHLYAKCADNDGAPTEMKETTIQNEVIIDGLRESSNYTFTLDLDFPNGFTLGQRQLSLHTRTLESRARLMISRSQPVANEADGFYELPKVEIARDTGFRRFRVGSNKISQVSEKVILVVGGTGSGKSTFINAMANYLYEIGFYHPFRLQLITKKDTFNESQSRGTAHSQTKMVSAYELNETRLPYRITIVDTPGFGDTDGIDRDKKTVEYIKEWFERRDAKGLQTIDAVCTIIKSSDTRLTMSAQYEMQLIHSLFGKDLTKNMIIAFTFCDNQVPIAVQTLQNELIGDVKLTFNNQCFTELLSNDSLLDIYWKRTSKSFEKLFSIIESFEPRSVVHTIEVLHRRKALEEQAVEFYKQVDTQINKIKEMEKVIEQLENGGNDMRQLKIKQKRFVKVQMPLQNGQFTTFCTHCSLTCHEDCREVKGNDKQRFNCDIMTVKNSKYAQCTICPNKCSWKAHSNNNVIVKQIEREEEVTVGQLLNQYQISMDDRAGTEILLEFLAKDLLKQDKVLGDIIKAIRQNLNVLSEIAMRPGLATDSQYLRYLIDSEMQNKQQGSPERVAVLQRHLKIVQLLEDEQGPNGRLNSETESAAVAYLGLKFPTLYKKLALKGYFNANVIRVDNRPVADEATLEQIERSYPVEYQSMRTNPSVKLFETSSKAAVVQSFKSIYPSLTAAAVHTLKEEADVDSVSEEKPPSEHTIDAELAELKSRTEAMPLHDTKPKKANKMSIAWKRITKPFRR